MGRCQSVFLESLFLRKFCVRGSAEKGDFNGVRAFFTSALHAILRVGEDLNCKSGQEKEEERS